MVWWGYVSLIIDKKNTVDHVIRGSAQVGARCGAHCHERIHWCLCWARGSDSARKKLQLMKNSSKNHQRIKIQEFIHFHQWINAKNQQFPPLSIFSTALHRSPVLPDLDFPRPIHNIIVRIPDGGTDEPNPMIPCCCAQLSSMENLRSFIEISDFTGKICVIIHCIQKIQERQRYPQKKET